MNAAVKPQTMNTIQAVNLALDEAMGLDANVIVLGEDVADGQEAPSRRAVRSVTWR